jgi:hypothetical protein
MLIAHSQNLEMAEKTYKITNALAYHDDKEKSFLEVTLGVCTIKLFTAVSYDFS